MTLHHFFSPIKVASIGAVIIIVTFSSNLVFLDMRFNKESIRDFYGRAVLREVWGPIKVSDERVDYDWLDQQSSPLRIAHALGGTSASLGNSEAALKKSLSKGFKFLEVDVWMDAAGNVFCGRGPSLSSDRSSEWPFVELLNYIRREDVYLVIDTKTDFNAASGAISDMTVNDESLRRKIIFQLYLPGDVQHFLRLTDKGILAGPILTAYRSRRSLNYLSKKAVELNIRALTVPLHRLEALEKRASTRPYLLVHPVKSCKDLQFSVGAGALGVYLSNGDICP